jgi:uncharacterized protein (DUF427 family)
MARATWNSVVLAESDACVIVEGNHYFPREAVRWEHLQPTGRTYTCAWKGVCDYYDVVAGDQRNPDAAWCYPEPRPAAQSIAGRVAFWRGVNVEP